MKNSLPVGWTEATVKGLCKQYRGISYGKGDAKNQAFPESVLVLRGGNIQDGKILLNGDDVFVNNNLVKPEQKLRQGDVIIVSSTGSKLVIGKAAQAENDFPEIGFGAFLTMLRPGNEVDKKFFGYFFQTDFYRNSIRELSGGVNINNIRNEHIASLYFPLPPLAEQKRIVAKLDAAFAHLETLKGGLERIPALLKKFRHTVLSHAVTGKLTGVQSVELKSLGEFLSDIKYGTSQKSEYDVDGIPILRIPNIAHGEIDSSDLKYSALEKKEYESLKLKNSDVLIIRSNGSVTIVGQSAIVRTAHEGWAYAGYLVRLRTKQNLNPEFLNYILKAPLLRSQIIEMARSTSGVNNINTDEIRSLKIPSFTLEEQQEIVTRVEALLAQADALETRYKALKALIDRLPGALLAKAFRGELVPQLPTEAPAPPLPPRPEPVPARRGPGQQQTLDF